jgi:hypothetical protein
MSLTHLAKKSIVSRDAVFFRKTLSPKRNERVLPGTIVLPLLCRDANGGISLRTIEAQKKADSCSFFLGKYRLLV